jgi:hypothetical protein
MNHKEEALWLDISKTLERQRIADNKYKGKEMKSTPCRLCNDTGIYQNTYCTHPVLEDEICITCNNNRKYTTLTGTIVDCTHPLRYRRLLA